MGINKRSTTTSPFCLHLWLQVLDLESSKVKRWISLVSFFVFVFPFPFLLLCLHHWWSAFWKWFVWVLRHLRTTTMYYVFLEIFLIFFGVGKTQNWMPLWCCNLQEMWWYQWSCQRLTLSQVRSGELLKASKWCGVVKLEYSWVFLNVGSLKLNTSFLLGFSPAIL